MFCSLRDACLSNKAGMDAIKTHCFFCSYDLLKAGFHFGDSLRAVFSRWQVFLEVLDEDQREGCTTLKKHSGWLVSENIKKGNRAVIVLNIKPIGKKNANCCQGLVEWSVVNEGLQFTKATPCTGPLLPEKTHLRLLKRGRCTGLCFVNQTNNI